MTYLFYALSSAAILVMLCGLVLVFRLRRVTRGGKVGRVVTILLGFILFFLAGYLFAPFLPQFSCEVALILTGVVFLFGAIFVVLVLRLIHALTLQVFKELKL